MPERPQDFVLGADGFVSSTVTSGHVHGDEELGCCRAGQQLELGTRWSSVAELCGSTGL